MRSELSRREAQVIGLRLLGLCPKESATVLGTAPPTVARQVYFAMKKLDLVHRSSFGEYYAAFWRSEQRASRSVEERLGKSTKAKRYAIA